MEVLYVFSQGNFYWLVIYNTFKEKSVYWIITWAFLTNCVFLLIYIITQKDTFSWMRFPSRVVHLNFEGVTWPTGSSWSFTVKEILNQHVHILLHVLGIFTTIANKNCSSSSIREVCLGCLPNFSCGSTVFWQDWWKARCWLDSKQTEKPQKKKIFVWHSKGRLLSKFPFCLLI